MNLFINYRRDDTSGHALLLFDRLRRKFGRRHVFIDVDTIQPGEDFPEVIEKWVNRSKVMLVLIGKNWHTIRNESGDRRIEDPKDFVRQELQAALDHKLPVLPVLIDGAVMPKENEVPSELHPLLRKNAFEIKTTRFHQDVDELIAAIVNIAGSGTKGSTKRPLKLLIFACLALAAALIYIYPSIVSGVWDRIQRIRESSEENKLPPKTQREKSSPEKLSIGSSYRWLQQTHRDCQAVYRVTPLDAGGKVEVLASFDTVKSELNKGEAIVYLTEGAVEKGDMTTFDPRRITMEADLPPQVEVDVFVKDRNWRSAYWRLPRSGVAEWQKIDLDFDKTEPRISDSDFDRAAGIALGWQFRTHGRSGQTRILLRNVQLDYETTNKESPVKREPMKQFLQRCGVDLGSSRASGYSGVALDESFSYLAGKRVRLVRVPFSQDMHDQFLWNDKQQLTGLNPIIYKKLDSLLAQASKQRLHVLLVLVNFDIVKKSQELINNPDVRGRLCDRVLKPFLSAYAANETIYGVELVSDIGGIREKFGEERAKVFAATLLQTVRGVAPRWKVLIGHESRSGMNAMRIPGFDEYIYRYDPLNQHIEEMKFRRDKLEFPQSDTPVLVLALLPPREYAAAPTSRPPFASYALQEAYDYGYAGIMLASPEGEPKRLSFPGREADAYDSWAKEIEASMVGEKGE